MNLFLGNYLDYEKCWCDDLNIRDTNSFVVSSKSQSYFVFLNIVEVHHDEM